MEIFTCNNAPKQKVKDAFYARDDDSTNEAHIRQKVAYMESKNLVISHI